MWERIRQEMHSESADTRVFSRRVICLDRSEEANLPKNLKNGKNGPANFDSQGLSAYKPAQISLT